MYAEIGGANAHIAACYFAICGDFWKNKWQQCRHTVQKLATEPIACKVKTRLSVEPNAHAHRWRKASSVLDPKCV